jgi:transcriptional regulator of acetoin/glycerol metabolism
MAGSAREVKIEHLPEDFLDDVGQLPASSDIVLPGPAKADLAQGNVRLEDVELLTIQKSLDEHRGNVSAAARALGVSRNTIYRKLQK